MKPIVFGTDGWRAVMAEDFTFARVRAVARATADYHTARLGRSPRLLVAYDARFQSAHFAEQAAGVLAAADAEVYLTDRETPTPVASFTVVERGLDGAVIVTASHNPPEWNGIKLKTARGASATEEVTREVQERANALSADPAWEEPAVPQALAAVQTIDPAPPYLERLRSLADLELIRRARPGGLKVVVDLMHGAMWGYFDRLLEDAGCRLRLVRAERNPGFGGVNPEPIAQNLAPSLALTREPEVDVGFATDGDGDRLGIMADGEYVNTHRMVALLLLHLAKNRGWRGAVARTVNTTSMVDRLAARYGLTLCETPVGFKHIAAIMLEEDLLLGGEESGGIGFRGHLPDRDAALSALFFCEMMAQEGKSVPELLAELWQEVGATFYVERVDLPLALERIEPLIHRLRADPPACLAGVAVTEVNPLDGAKCICQDGTWLLIRPSGTEPLVRVYAEAHSEQRLQALLEEGRRLVLSAEGGR